MISAQLFVSIIVCLFIPFGVMLPACAYLIFLERKIASWCQDRIGPNRVGFSFGQDNLWRALGMNFMNRWSFAGFGQALADGIKLFFKEEYTPPRADLALFLLAPVLVVVPALLGWAVIPWGGVVEFPGLSIGGRQLVEAGVVSVAAAPLNIGVVYILAIGSLAVYGVVLGAFASNHKYSFLGGIRATAQMVSYEIPLGLCVLIAILTFQTTDAGAMVNLQATSISSGGGAWGIFQHPLLAVIFFTCILAECNRAPFDLPEAETELVGGYHTEYSSMKWALFFLGEYMHMITGSAFFAVLFLGGWSVAPFIGDLPLISGGWMGLVVVLLKFHVFVGKVATLLIVMMWIRWTLPRFRFDQLMRLAWQGLIPLTVSVLIVSGLLVYLQWNTWWMFCLANLAVAIGGAALAPHMPRGPAVNRKVRLAGSRFYPPLPEGEA
ncbi:MAG: NADH-quinone oxidoreductase subunit H [Phycisphaeraceae bacterium]|nr:NADH-quinone oxidoreductase subunit H [Phycisphaeraceae bacterium]